MISGTLFHLLVTYKYAILFPLACFEGPIISLFVGFMVYAGYINFLPAYIVLLFGDIIPDSVYYFIGRYGNKSKLFAKYGSKFEFVSKNIKLIEYLWRDHGKKTMFFSKLAYGLSTPFLVSAGLVNMKWRRFISYALPVTIFQYAVFMTAGYFLGSSYFVAAKYIQDAGIIIALVILTAFIFLYRYFARYAKKKITEMEIEEEIKTK
ncbi:MAG: VTT domain-containing protein [Candidatus Pacebacteria bacterium]|nr:VTT domain-containing protein [Candidatus Paceibacterota bacterium]